MYQKIKNLRSILIVITVVNIIYIIYSLIVANPLVVSLILIAFNLVLLNSYLVINKQLQHDIKVGRELIPVFASKTIDAANYSILMYNKNNNKVIWENEYFNENFGVNLGKDVTELFDGALFDEDSNLEYLKYKDKYYNVVKESGTIIFKDVTNLVSVQQKYIDERDCIAFLRLDSLEDMSASMDELTYQSMISEVRRMISDFASEFDLVIRRYKNDTYIIVLKQKNFTAFVERALKLLDDAQDLSNKFEDSTTLSMGIATGFEKLQELEEQAGLSLDMALSRGGDQIVVKNKGFEYNFLGGNSESSEKRNRVKVRMVANTLEDLVRKASNVIIMPHKNADFDALGASYGMAKFASIYNKDAYICCNVDELEDGTKDAYHRLKLESMNLLYTENQLFSVINDDTLLVILDNSSLELLESPEIYNRVKNRVVIDHHRKSNSFIENPLLVYIETYASSTVELVIELLQFQSKSFKLSNEVATLMLAGMMVDSDYFTVRTGVRTFEAATFLRDKGASPSDAKEILQVNQDAYRMRLEMIQAAKIIDKSIILSTYDKNIVTTTMLAQGAVELLGIKDIMASFTIGKLANGKLGLSARSNGEFNVQKIAEEFGGGGHYSMAAAQVDNISIEEFAQQVEAKVREMLKGEE